MYDDYLRTLLRIKIVIQEEQSSNLTNVSYSGPSDDGASTLAQASAQVPGASGNRANIQTNQAGVTKAKTVARDKSDPYANVGRNDQCPCGSGKKYKKCHGAAA
jgi:preprotein translocase subunit SecA